MKQEYYKDEQYGEQLLISICADQRELTSNIRAARAILKSFPDVSIIINPHTMTFGHKNPENTTKAVSTRPTALFNLNGCGA